VDVTGSGSLPMAGSVVSNVQQSSGSVAAVLINKTDLGNLVVRMELSQDRI